MISPPSRVRPPWMKMSVTMWHSVAREASPPLSEARICRGSLQLRSMVGSLESVLPVIRNSTTNSRGVVFTTLRNK